MNHPYLLAQEPGSAIATSPRHRSTSRVLRFGDPALNAMTDFQRCPPLTVREQCSLDDAMDDMFRLGVRALLVVRERTVVGLLTADDAHDRRLVSGSGRAAGHSRGALKVADVMTPSVDVPAIDWQTLQQSRIADLIEIFEGTGIGHLVVLESVTPARSSVRGLIHRSRLERQLNSVGSDIVPLRPGPSSGIT